MRVTARTVRRSSLLVVATALSAAGLVASAHAQEGSVGFQDIGPAAGLDYRRGPGVLDAKAAEAYSHVPFTFSGDLMHETPTMTRLAGVALLDADGDGDQDVFATNGPRVKGDATTGPGHSLYRNLLRETGRVQFQNVSEEAGIQAKDHNGAGVAYGDLDNDGDEDLLVLGDNEPNRLFANHGDGTFADVSAASGLAEDHGSHTSASLGDVNGDGLLDIVVAQGMDRHNLDTCFNFYADGRDIGRNQIFLNLGGLRFDEASATSGIQNTRWFRDADGPRRDLDGLATITWATAVVDYDRDGDADVLFADDQCNALPAKLQHLFDDRRLVDRGLLHLFRNDGRGRFTDVSGRVGLDKEGAWMGLAFADFDSNGALDVYATNFGDYSMVPLMPYERGDLASRAFYGQRSGAFADPGADDVKATTFGWGTGALDYDNDGCTDVIYEGGLDVVVMVERSNPGTLLHNRCGSAAGKFEQDVRAYPPTQERIRRNPYGVATGDLDDDGFTDVLSASTYRVPGVVPAMNFPPFYGAASDAAASFFPRMVPLDPVDPTDPRHTPPEHWQPIGLPLEDGALAAERNSGNSNGWIKVRAIGAKGLVRGGKVNRDGIGAIVTVTPKGGRPATLPVLGGSSFLSQHELTLGFGLGQARTATVDVLWPGGRHTHLTGVRSGERLAVPELPCEAGGRGRECRSLTTTSAKYQEGSRR